ncbi:hypothetical protein LUZ60_008896 [Juncus effusus]|nr:hypothetical protein LUZ60_008896 [Juncus effusus]
MENCTLDEEQDDLEIISIGALYRGDWEKKYWSSSRAKDRYPYPVGYHASRIHAGNRCKMEIGEGPRGPLFMVGPADEELCVGVTPELAWESFLKKSKPKAKNWQGRTFSSKIDGTELFGFKNKVVQKLLHQLIVASSRSPLAQKSSSPLEQISSSTLKSIETLPEKTFPKNNDFAFVYSRKRGVKHKAEERKAKKKHQQFLVDHKEGPSGTGTTVKESLAVLADSQNEAERKDDLEMKTGDIEMAVENLIISEQDCSISQNMPFEAENLLKGISENENDDFMKIVPDSPISIHENDYFMKIVPDSPVSIHEAVKSSSANEVVQDSQPNSSNEVVDDSQTSSSANISSQRTDQGSEKQELTRSMMEFLLPQAVPLLPKKERRYSRKKLKNKRRQNISSSCHENDQPIQDDEMKVAELKTEAMDQESEEKTLGEMVKANTEHFDTLEEGNCVIADSFEDNIDQKMDSPISRNSFEDNSNHKIDSSILSPVTKEGANLQNDPGELTDSFLAGLEEEICAIENAALLKKTNTYRETLMDPSGNSEIPKGIIYQNFDETVLQEEKFNLFGPYQHPEPVLSLTLSSKDDNCLEICVLCGELNTRERSIYIYNLVLGQPSFVGYTSMFINSAEHLPNENLPIQRAGLQYISDGRLLALIPSIKTPYCRKLRIDCSCAICKMEEIEENAVKLVRVDFGFVVPVAKMKTNEKVSSVLVCKPNYVIAVETTRLHVWVMSSKWRTVSDELTLSTLENMVPSKLELEEIPDSKSLILGHDGFGAFCLWDISKRALLAKFEAPPNCRISKMIPLSWLDLNKTEFSNSDQNMKLCVRDSSTNNPIGENCLAVWLLVECQTDLKAMNRSWRLALLAKNALFMGHLLDPRIFVVDACANFGFAGTHDGFCYKWDLYSGKQVASMDCFYSGSVSCIAADPKSGAVAVALANSENQVLIYTQHN